MAKQSPITDTKKEMLRIKEAARQYQEKNELRLLNAWSEAGKNKVLGTSVEDWQGDRSPTRLMAMLNCTWLRSTLTRILVNNSDVKNDSLKCFVVWLMIGVEFDFLEGLFHDKTFIRAWYEHDLNHLHQMNEDPEYAECDVESKLKMNLDFKFQLMHIEAVNALTEPKVTQKHSFKNLNVGIQFNKPEDYELDILEALYKSKREE